VYPASTASEQVEDKQGLALSPVGRLGAEPFQPATAPPEKWTLGPMAGRSAPMQHLFTRMRCTAPHFRLVNIEGESGAGKMLAAQTLHGLGPASAGAFVPCLAAEFLESPEARWKEIRGGMVYLSRVDELNPDQQRRLRDFLDRSAHERLRFHTSSGPLQVVAGSAQPLRRLAAAGAFRSDLANHLTAIRFVLPPLRDRRDDIPLLAGLFLGNWSHQNDKPLRGFAPGTLNRLLAHPWPGNVRELESVIVAAALECSGQWIRPIDIPRLDWPLSAPDPASQELSADDPNLDRAILRHIVRVLARANGNKVRAARMLGISRSTLYRILDPDNPTPSGHDSLTA
jgi:two-component system response regulator AtoC